MRHMSLTNQPFYAVVPHLCDSTACFSLSSLVSNNAATENLTHAHKHTHTPPPPPPHHDTDVDTFTPDPTVTM